MASLSIVIPSHRRVDLLATCLRSVREYQPAGTQVIVVDDGSKAGVVSQCARSFGVEVIRHAKANGFCAAVNAGIAAASGDVVELLNDDAQVTAGWAETVLPHFEDETVAAVTPLVLLPDGTIDTAGDDYDVGGFATKRKTIPLKPTDCVRGGAATTRPVASPTDAVGGLEISEVQSVSACAAFYRRETLIAIGGFPEHFGAYFDDVDVSLRLRRHYYRLLLEPRSRVIHRVSQSHAPSRRLLQQQSRNEEWLYWRNRESWKTLPRHVAVLAGKALRRVEERTLLPWLAGRLDALRLMMK